DFVVFYETLLTFVPELFTQFEALILEEQNQRWHLGSIFEICKNTLLLSFRKPYFFDLRRKMKNINFSSYTCFL
ncbi:hypothetical protein NUQ34_09690, partial [Glaesserella parasuis]|nr:hypothetical protein [Glaesserella parasuis]